MFWLKELCIAAVSIVQLSWNELVIKLEDLEVMTIKSSALEEVVIAVANDFPLSTLSRKSYHPPSTVDSRRMTSHSHRLIDSSLRWFAEDRMHANRHTNS